MNNGSRPEKENPRHLDASKAIFTDTAKLKSINNWLTAITILLVASFAINVFLYSISINQRTDILNLQDTIDEKNRIIKQYKFKNNEQ